MNGDETELSWGRLTCAVSALAKGEALDPQDQAEVNRAFLVAWFGGSLDPLANLNKRRRGRPAKRPSADTSHVRELQVLLNRGSTKYAAAKVVAKQFHMTEITVLRDWKRARDFAAPWARLAPQLDQIMKALGLSQTDWERTIKLVRSLPDDGRRFKAADTRRSTTNG